MIYEPRRKKTCLRGLPKRSDIKRAVQPQNMNRGLKVRIGLYYLCGENKGADH